MSMNPTIALALIAAFACIIVLTLQLDKTQTKVEHLEKACIPTYTGGGVWQCHQPAMKVRG